MKNVIRWELINETYSGHRIPSHDVQDQVRVDKKCSKLLFRLLGERERVSFTRVSYLPRNEVFFYTV